MVTQAIISLTAACRKDSPMRCKDKAMRKSIRLCYISHLKATMSRAILTLRKESVA